jgi:rRNA maturation endonuclease Nob1
MKALLGCEHCGRVVRRLRDVEVHICAACGKPLREIGLIEAHALQRERRIASDGKEAPG